MVLRTLKPCIIKASYARESQNLFKKGLNHYKSIAS